MGITKWIWIKNKRYYLYETYNTWEEALKQAKRHRKKNKCRYFIQAYDAFKLIPINQKKYALYLDKSIGIW